MNYGVYKMNISSFIKQAGISDVVYHVTIPDRLLNILKTNRFLTSVAISSEAELAKSKNKLYYFSTARSMQTPYFPNVSGFSIDYFVVLTLDGTKLRENFKAMPINFWGGGIKVKEFEDRIITDKPFIDNATKYIKSIRVNVGSEKIIPKNKIEVLSKIEEIAKSKSIPFSIYNSFENIKKVKAKPSFSSVTELENSLDFVSFSKKDTEYKWGYRYSDEEPEALVDLIKHVSEEKLTKESKNLLKLIKSNPEAYRDISQILKRFDKDPDVRPVPDFIWKSFVKSKTNDFKKFIEEIKDFYKAL